MDDVGAVSDGSVALPRIERRPGLVTITSAQSFDATVASIRAAIAAGPPTEVFTLDHRANAATVGLDLRPTTLVVFGNPALGTPLMQDRRTIGIDLPQKILVHEDAAGEVQVTWNDPRDIARRHRVRGQVDVQRTIADALAGLAAVGAEG